MRKVVLLLLFFSIWLSAALPSSIQHFINRAKLPQKDVSIYIKELGSNRVIASLNADRVRKPASVVKVLTGYAALLQLGFDYRWPTEFYKRGDDLIVKGYGDPSLSSDDIPQIVTHIKRSRLRSIDDIIIDRSYFDVGDKDSAHFDSNPYSPYNAMPDAMMFDERTSTVCITPKSKDVYKELNDPSYDVVNNVEFVNRSCRGKYAWANSKVDMQNSTPRLILKGKLSKHCGERKVCMIVTKPYKAFFYALKEALENEGIDVRGTLRLSKVPSGSSRLFTHYSEPLEKIVAKASKESNNIYARHLMLLAGAKVYGAPATVNKGRKALERLIGSQGVQTGKLYIDNGSGLSRKSKMTARGLSNTLESAYKVYGKRWMDTLSIAGKDGTIKKRFRYKAAHHRAWMKTGTLKGVRNIGGYVKNRGGNYYSVVVFVNTGKGRSKATKLQNDIINWLSKTTKTPSKRFNAQGTKSVKSLSKQEIKKSQPAVQKTQGNYYIQVSSGFQKPPANYLKRISNAGYSYEVVRTDRYRVFIGGYSSKASAKSALPNVRKTIRKDAFIVKR